MSRSPKRERKPVRFKAEKLSPPGRMLVEGMIFAGATYDAIVAALRGETGESVGASSIARYRSSVLQATKKLQEPDLFGLIRESTKLAWAGFEVCFEIKAASGAILITLKKQNSTQRTEAP